MKVKLLAYTLNPDLVCGAAARSCYSEDSARVILHEHSRDKIIGSLRKCIEKGHASVLEHANFTFSVEGVSRILTHQLVRHRIASYSQRSMRYVKANRDYVMPPSISKNSPARKRFAGLMDEAWNVYEELLVQGIPVEDARFALPHAVKTGIVITMNARELLHFFELRTCQHTQWELRELAKEMLKLVKKAAPVIFEKAGPPCVARGLCPEKDEKCPMHAKCVNPGGEEKHDG